MKTTNITTRNKSRKKFLRTGASALLLVLLFVVVFSGVLASAFSFEQRAIKTGLIDANVAEASGRSGYIASTGGMKYSFNDLTISDFYRPRYSKSNFVYYRYGNNYGFGCYASGRDNDEYYAYLKFPLEADIVNAVKNNVVINLTFGATVVETDEDDWNDDADDCGICILPAKHEPNDDHKYSYVDVQNGKWQTRDSEGAFSSFNDTMGTRTATLALTEDKITGNDNGNYVWLVFCACNDDRCNFMFNTIYCTLKMASSISNVNFTSGGHGSVSPSGNQTFNGTSTNGQYNNVVGELDVTTTPDTGYHFSNWTHNNANTIYGLPSDFTTNSTYSTYTFKGGALRANTTFTAHFAPNTLTVQYNNNDSGGTYGASGSVPSNTVVNYENTVGGTAHRFTIANGNTLQGTNYAFTGWGNAASSPTSTYLQGATCALDSGYFDLRSGDQTKTVYATWAYIQFTFGAGAAAGTGGTAYTASNQYSPSTALSVLKGISGYLSVQTSNLPSGYSATIQYSTQNL